MDHNSISEVHLILNSRTTTIFEKQIVGLPLNYKAKAVPLHATKALGGREV
jgi:hypothetical protein